MIPRTLSKKILSSLKTFPSLILTGPRQSGKTTLVKNLLAKSHKYISLENPDIRQRAVSDPNGFLIDINQPVILDEIQYVPELLSYIKTCIDEDRRPGRWVLTGSQNFVLMNKVSESLAGRAAILSLLPLTIKERLAFRKDNLNQIILNGGYPEIVVNNQIDRKTWIGSFINTYLERDIRSLSQVGDLGMFELFLRSCAIRTGQILDLTNISKELGISLNTAKKWLSLLQTGYQILLVYPYYKNIGKRLIKRPKMYFTDTGLATFLLGLHTQETLVSSPHYGAIFETLVITDRWKSKLHEGEVPGIFYFKTRDGLEVDLVEENENLLDLAEIKSSGTIRPEHANSLIRASRDISNVSNNNLVISTAKDNHVIVKNIRNSNWLDFAKTGFS